MMHIANRTFPSFALRSSTDACSLIQTYVQTADTRTDARMYKQSEQIHLLGRRLIQSIGLRSISVSYLLSCSIFS